MPEKKSHPSKSTLKLFQILGGVITIIIPIWLVLSSARLLMTEAYLQYEYSKPDFPADPFGFTQEERQQYAPFVIRYLQNDSGVEYLGDLTFPDGHPMYNSRELRHMQDVKVVSRAAFAAHAILTLFLVGTVILSYGKAEAPTYLRKGVARGAYLTLGGILALVILVTLNWSFFFEGFHKLFFEEGTWRFEYTDTLIRLFPERFWFDAAITIGILTASGAVICLLLVWSWKHISKRAASGDAAPAER